MTIEWYPGHMTKARREMETALKLVDVIVEILDARVPQSSRNPDLAAMGQGKSRILLLNKADLADPVRTKQWIAYLEGQGFAVLALDGRVSRSAKGLRAFLENAVRAKREKDLKRGILNRPTRIMIVGIPNVGKSTIINTLAGSARAKTGDKPGVTRGHQWITLGSSLELLDTPGILWPRFDDPAIGERLALLGSIRDEVLIRSDLALAALRLLEEEYPDALAARYGFTAADPVTRLEELAQSRHLLKKGGEPDLDRAADVLLDELRKGRIGAFTLDPPPAEETN